MNKRKSGKGTHEEEHFGRLQWSQTVVSRNGMTEG